MPTTTTTTYLRARRPEQKQERAQQLLAAARELALENGVRSVTLTAISDRVGLHHSAMRRYFSSHREVLLRLAGEGWRSWADAVEARLAERESTSPDELVDTLTETLAADPLFCDLLGNVPLRLEHDVDIEYVREFKRVGIGAFNRMVAAVAAAVPELGSAGATDVMVAANYLAATMWQVSHPTEQLARLYREEPDLAHVVVDFDPQFRHLLGAVVHGLLALGERPESGSPFAKGAASARRSGPVRPE